MLMYLILLQARAFFQAALSMAPHMYEPHYNWAALADQVRVHHGATSLCFSVSAPPPQSIHLSPHYYLITYRPFTLSFIFHEKCASLFFFSINPRISPRGT